MLLAAQRTLPSRALKAEPARQRQEGAAGFVAPSGWGVRGAQKMDAPQDEHQHGGFGGPRTAGVVPSGVPGVPSDARYCSTLSPVQVWAVG